MAVMSVRDAREELRQVAHSYERFKEFITDVNLKLIAKWAREALGTQYEVRGRGLICKHPWDPTATKVLKSPRKLPELDLEVLEFLNPVVRPRGDEP